jgi:NAD(P)-dependent dehydrogenase (short-subunit alcohol dehydrogenase family)
MPGPGACDAAALLPERPRADLAETIALRRFGNAADVAALVASLLCADPPAQTGRVLEVPGALAL